MMPLEELLPQASPMILLSGYEPGETPGTANAYVEVTRESPFFERASRGVPSCVALEYMAQTMALAVGEMRRAAGLPPQIGFVLGSRKFETFIPAFAENRRYRVKAVNTYQDESFGSFDCEVVAPDGTLAARATMTAFQPTGELTEEKLKEYE